ncbi:hypothetical protein Hanom_Chr02g00123451 [Helianthus anomalus]
MIFIATYDAVLRVFLNQEGIVGAPISGDAVPMERDALYAVPQKRWN